MTGPAHRRDALRAALAHDAEAVLVTHLVNVRYLSGFTGSNAALLVTRGGADVLATDGRYATQAAEEAPGVELVVTRALTSELLRRAAELRVSRLAIERHDVTLEVFDRISGAADGIDLVSAEQVVETLRVVKDDEELAHLAAACAVTDEAFDDVLPRLREGVTEREVGWALRAAMHAHGAEPAFDSIVAFGPNSARPHHRPTDRPLRRGELVKLDFGAEVAGYHADMTRTVALGPVADWQRDLHALVAGIQADALERVVPGAVPAELDAVVRKTIEAAGHEPAHGLGHGVGLQVHESPFLVPGSSADRLLERVPVTVEPGVYLPGRGGVRIEDTVVVRADAAEALTRSTRDLLVL